MQLQSHYMLYTFNNIISKNKLHVTFHLRTKTTITSQLGTFLGSLTIAEKTEYPPLTFPEDYTLRTNLLRGSGESCSLEVESDAAERSFVGADVDGGLVRVGEVDEVDVAHFGAGESQKGVVGVGAQHAESWSSGRGKLEPLVRAITTESFKRISELL